MITTGNNSNSKMSVLFYERLAYSEIGYPLDNPADLPSSTNMDFLVLKPFYARIDTFSDIVTNATIRNGKIIENSFIKRFTTPNQSAMNFVVDSFVELESEFNSGCLRISGLNRTGPLSNIRPLKSWRSPVQRYREYFSTLYRDSVDNRVDGQTYKNVRTVHEFLKIFMMHLEYKATLFPVTFNNYCISRHGNILTSGLALEIETGDYGDDFEKTARFVSNVNFKYYLELAQKYGFFVDRDVPWRIVANLKSQKMIERMKAYDISSTEDLFEKQFTKAYKLDIVLLREQLFNCYNLFINEFKNSVISKFDGCKVEIQNIIRTPISFEEFNKQITDLFLLKIYCYFRCIEIKSGITQVEFNNIVKDVSSFYKAYGLDPALRHANFYFNGLVSLTLDKKYLTTKQPDVSLDQTVARKLTPKISSIM
jgi:hypothetical protein